MVHTLGIACALSMASIGGFSRCCERSSTLARLLLYVRNMRTLCEGMTPQDSYVEVDEALTPKRCFHTLHRFPYDQYSPALSRQSASARSM